MSNYRVWQFNFFDIFRIKKCGEVILLQSVTDCYYKIRQVLQSVTVITKWDVTATWINQKDFQSMPRSSQHILLNFKRMYIWGKH